MQDPRRRPAPPFAGVDLRRPKGYPARAAAEEEPASSALEHAPPAGDPCPRCESRDTKFCYYNNYNTSQPRHFCKSCRRYWTKGGSLRNVPVGGGTRKSSSSSSVSSPSPAAAPNKSAKRSKNSKRRRVAPAPDPDPVPGTDASSAATTTTGVASNAPAPAPPTVGAATDNKQPTATEPAATEKPTATTAATDEKLMTAPPAVVGCFTSDTSAPPGLGLPEVGCGGGKELPPDPNHFEWPSGCDLVGSYWNTGVFADTDPALFLNLP